jgi:hypothetical protein
MLTRCMLDAREETDDLFQVRLTKRFCETPGFFRDPQIKKVELSFTIIYNDRFEFFFPSQPLNHRKDTPPRRTETAVRSQG